MKKFLQNASNNTKGILCLIGSLVFLTLSDSIVKWLSPTYALHEIMLFRALFAMVVVVIIVQFEGGWKSLYTRRPALHLLRGCLLVLANMFFFLGLATLPLADTVALFFTAPLFICLMAQPVLGEKVGLGQWAAIFLGLFGVLVMVRPGADVFRLASLLPMMAALTYAVMQMVTRKLGMQDKAGTLTFYIQISFILISTVIGLTVGDGHFNQGTTETLSFLFRAWVWPTTSDIYLLATCGVIVGIGGYLLSQAYRMGQASVVAPFEYSSMPYALLVGYFVWGDWPDLWSFVGSGLIILSGLIISILESQKNKLAAKPIPFTH